MPGLESCGLPESSLTSIGGLRLAKPDARMRERMFQSRTRVELYYRVLVTSAGEFFLRRERERSPKEAKILQ